MANLNTTGRKSKEKPSSERKTVSIKKTPSRKSTTKKEKNLKKNSKGKVEADVDLDLSGSEGDVPKEVEIEYVP
jgi:hypothetical protein